MLFRLDDLVTSPKSDIVDGPFGSNLKASEYRESGVPIARLQNVDPNVFVRKNIRFVSEEKATELSRHNFKGGDLLITKLGDPLGEACIVPADVERGVIVADLVRVRLDPKRCVKTAVCYAINSNVAQAQFKRETKGTTRPRVNLGMVRSLRLPLPTSLHEQQRIVAEIEKQFTRLDAGVASLKRVQTALKRYRASVLKAACEGRLVPTEAELARKENRTYETGEQLLHRILEQRRQKWNGKGKYKQPSAVEPGTPPTIPEGWTVASAEALCSSVRDGTHDTPAYVDKGVPLVTLKNLLETGLDFENVKMISREDYIEIGKRSGVDRGDILFAMIGTIGNPVVVETNREFAIKNVDLFKANTEFILPRYLCYWLMSPQFIRWLERKQKGTTQKFVPLALLRALIVALPPLVEQRRIVAEVDRRLSMVDELEALTETNQQRATRLRHSVLQCAFSGALLCGGEL